jgi:predicted glycogen debranching enzyme
MLEAGNDVTLVASMESWGVIHALKPIEAFKAEIARRSRIIAGAFPEKRSQVGAELALAADQFVISPITRIMDAALARAAGSEPRSIVAGYHWFTDWGRDTMISLEGLTLATGRFTEAAYILRTFAQYVREGLIPNLFPEGETKGLYHTADATLWFFHAIDRYIQISGDRAILSVLLPVCREIVERHIGGTRFGIGLDPEDGLLRQGEDGYALTWMDAKAGDWVVTPRRGKAVEINALWYNALRLYAAWLREEHEEEPAERISSLADKARDTFNGRFWYEAGGYLYDIVDGENGDDPALRPNQLFAVSLAHPVLDPARWKSVLKTVEERLLTPFGLRTLGRDHPDYKLEYAGDLLSRDAAYHQGTVWPWLIGPFIDARLKAYPEDRDGTRRYLLGLLTHLDDACIGTIGEVFDAEPPFRPEGCISQAWSVAEVLRCWIKSGT